MSRINFRLRGCLPGLLLLFAAAAWQEAEAAPRKAANGATPMTGAAASAKSASGLDTATIRRYYLDGEFDPAIALLENTLKTGSGFTHEDSVFIFKHLGVMYAARFETREKGKHYMHRLLEAEPTARILDMYASDMIYMIFKNIKEEFEASRLRFVRADSLLGGGGQGAGAVRKDEPVRRREEPRKGTSAYLWVGAAAVAAAGAATWFYLSNERPEVHYVTENHAP